MTGSGGRMKMFKERGPKPNRDTKPMTITQENKSIFKNKNKTESSYSKG
jgi:hypothetical protein